MALLTRREVPQELTWNLTDIYASDDAWEQDFTLLSARMEELERLDGTLAGSVASLLQALHLRDTTSQLVQRLRGYAALRLDEDTTQLVAALFARLAVRVR